MRILYIVDQFPPLWGTLAHRASVFAEHFAKEGLDVTVMTFGSPPGLYRGPGYTVLRLPSFPLSRGGAISRVVQYMWEGAGAVVPAYMARPHVVLVSLPQYLLGIVGVLLRKAGGVPLVLEVRDLWPDSIVLLQDGLVDHAVYRLLNELSRFVFSQAHAFVATNPAIARHIVRRHGVPRKRVHVIPTPYVPVNKMGSRYQKNKNPVLFYGGNLGFSQGPELLVETACEISRLLPSARVVVAGDGSLRSRFLALKEKEQVHNLVYLGSLPRSKVIKQIASSTACLVMLRNFPGLRTALPGKLLEYMAAGKPIVAALKGEGARIVRTARCGVVVPPENPVSISRAFAQLVDDQETARAMGKNGVDYIYQYHQPRVLTQRYMSIIRETAG